MTDLVSLFAFADAAGISAERLDPAGYECGSCRKVLPAWALVLPNEETDDPDDVICGNCHFSLQRVATFEAEQEAKAKLAIDAPWETDAGLEAKAVRNRLIAGAMWAVDRDTSPLSPACQDAWRVYVRALNRLTVDYPCPTRVEWPVEPTLEYP